MQPLLEKRKPNTEIFIDYGPEFFLPLTGFESWSLKCRCNALSCRSNGEIKTSRKPPPKVKANKQKAIKEKPNFVSGVRQQVYVNGLRYNSKSISSNSVTYYCPAKKHNQRKGCPGYVMLLAEARSTMQPPNNKQVYQLLASGSAGKMTDDRQPEPGKLYHILVGIHGHNERCGEFKQELQEQRSANARRVAANRALRNTLKSHLGKLGNTVALLDFQRRLEKDGPQMARKPSGRRTIAEGRWTKKNEKEAKNKWLVKFSLNVEQRREALYKANKVIRTGEQILFSNK